MYVRKACVGPAAEMPLNCWKRVTRLYGVVKSISVALHSTFVYTSGIKARAVIESGLNKHYLRKQAEQGNVGVSKESASLGA